VINIMDVVFRVDAANHIGSGHVVRCITLAKELLRILDVKVTFFCRDFDGNLISFISSHGFKVKVLSYGSEEFQSSDYNSFLRASYDDDAKATIELLSQNFSRGVDWLIIDHYGIDEKWEELLKPYCHNMMCIDDLNNRKHSCDLILDQNYTASKKQRYSDSNAQKLIGPKYALLRDEFRLLDIPEYSERERKILVFFGGVDINNETLKALKGIDSLGFKGTYVDVILGQSNPHIAEIEAYCSDREQFKVYIQISDMAKRMSESRLFVGAGGSTALERACCGLPSIVTAVASNQIESSESLDIIGVHHYLGVAETLTPTDYAQAVQSLIESDIDLFEMAESALDLVDGQGVIRVVETMKQLSNEN
jgi:UDP-2,4-diacetamido-2,4,6-trideoxy-beta-L-altropyranose hydrolase